VKFKNRRDNAGDNIGSSAPSAASSASADVTPNTDETLRTIPSSSGYISSPSARARLRFLDGGLCALLEPSLCRQGIGSEERGLCEGPFGFPSPCADASVVPNDIATAQAKINSTTSGLTQIIFGPATVGEELGISEKSTAKGGKDGTDFGKSVKTRRSEHFDDQYLGLSTLEVPHSTSFPQAASALSWSLIRPQPHTKSAWRRLQCVLSGLDKTKRIGFRQYGQTGGSIGGGWRISGMVRSFRRGTISP
jgi:hypothetical protein